MAKIKDDILVKTTALEIHPPSEYSFINNQYRLVRYTFPDGVPPLKYEDFSKLHMQLRDQLDAPYRVYQHDKLESSGEWAVYVLYNPLIPSQTLKYSNWTLKQKDTDFGQLEFHMQVKVLLTLFSQPTGQSKMRFTGHNDCYLYVKEEKDKKHTCLKISLNQDAQYLNRFYVSSQATLFEKIGEAKRPPRHNEPRYEYRASTKSKGILFSQVRPKSIKDDKDLFFVSKSSDSRAMLSFHLNDKPAEARGYHMVRFIDDFKRFLGQFGFSVNHIPYYFKKHQIRPQIQNYQLPLSKLGTIWVYDIRENQQEDLESHLQIFRELAPNITFEYCDSVPNDKTKPVLIFQDKGKDDYKKSEIDPYKVIYKKYRNTPKQSINIGDTRYIKDKSHRCQVVLNHLFLKYVVMNRINLNEWLDDFNHPDYIYIYDSGSKSKPMSVGLVVQDGNIEFLNLLMRPDSEKFNTYLNQFGFNHEDWYRFRQQMCQRRRGTEANCENINELKFKAIIGKNVMVELFEQYTPQLFYDHIEIAKRRREMDKPYDINHFLLPVHNETRAEHNAHIEEIARESKRKTLSFNELRHDKKLIEIWGSKRKLTDAYKDLFPGTRQETLIPLNKGIAYTQDWAYIVGGKDSLNNEQPRAYLVRQFIPHTGANNFDIEAILDSMSVTFIRFRQYTVYPFYFSLLNRYIENELKRY